MLTLSLLLACTGATPDDTAVAGTPSTSPLGDGDGSPESVEFTYILGEEEKVFDPRDIGFDAEGNLWIANRSDDRTFIVFNPGTPDQDYDRRKDGYAEHFMEETMALSFDTGEQFGSCGESRNTYNDNAPPNDFMGPVLWSTDLEIFAEQNPEGLGSHLDMLHESPLCMGMAWEVANVYWVFDGKNESIVRYDFAEDHDVGQDYHGDGIVRRLDEPVVAREEDVPSHMMIDPATGILYVADTGNDRVLWIDTASGQDGGNLRVSAEPVEEYVSWEGASWGVFAEGFDRPAGLATDGENVWVGEYGTGVIHELDMDGNTVYTLDTGVGEESLHGIELGPDGKLWIVDNAGAAVLRIDPPNLD